MQHSTSPVRVAFLHEAQHGYEGKWSGMLSAACHALGLQLQVEDIGVDTTSAARLDRGIARGMGIIGQAYLPAHAATSAMHWGRTTSKALERRDVDAVVAIAASHLTAFAHLNVPLISVSDATFPLTAPMYPGFTKMPGWAKAQAMLVERRAWNRSAACVLTSKWAARSLVEDYRIPVAKCHVVPFGPGVSRQSEVVIRDPGRPLRLLWVARDAQRKRADRILAMLPLLEHLGVDFRLTVVGQASPIGEDKPKIAWLGSQTADQLSTIYRSSDVLIELADANCASVTLTDATAAGLPVVATDIGATSEIIGSGRIGHMVSNGPETPWEAAKAVAAISNPDRYRDMRRAIAEQAHDNWRSWGRAMRAIIEAVVIK